MICRRRRRLEQDWGTVVFRRDIRNRAAHPAPPGYGFWMRSSLWLKRSFDAVGRPGRFADPAVWAEDRLSMSPRSHPFRLDGKVAAITGAGSGIGRAIAV